MEAGDSSDYNVSETAVSEILKKLLALSAAQLEKVYGSSEFSSPAALIAMARLAAADLRIDFPKAPIEGIIEDLKKKDPLFADIPDDKIISHILALDEALDKGADINALVHRMTTEGKGEEWKGSESLGSDSESRKRKKRRRKSSRRKIKKRKSSRRKMKKRKSSRRKSKRRRRSKK